MKHLYSALLACAVPSIAAAAPVHDFLSVAISPDGARVASVEGDEGASGVADIKSLVIRTLAGGAVQTVRLPCGAVHDCAPSSLAWAPDSKKLSFVLRSPGTYAHAIYTADAATGALTQHLAFSGTLADLRYGPGGKLAVLATEGAAKEVGATEAGAALTGVLGADVHEQRIAVLGDDGTLRYASPGDLFVYEYDWRPDGKGFVGTASLGDGDANWWTAKLYAFDAAQGAAHVIFSPPNPQLQLARPAVSPDGSAVSFIGGLMSDFGATGGEAYVLKLAPKAVPVDVTPGWKATVTSLAWGCDGHLLASLLHGDQTQLVQFGPEPASSIPAPVFSAPEVLQGNGSAVSLACGVKTAAAIHQSFARAPEIAVGPFGAWHDVTQVNVGQVSAAAAQSINWTNDGFTVQGWLLRPKALVAGAARMPMITMVHGGPAYANEPHFFGTQGLGARLLGAGYALFLPNPRGSFGQGEVFTKANVKDFGYGDLRDILSGVTAAEHVAPIDEARLGLTGGSYGGYMTMWAVTQTNRFHAAVAVAGVSDWLSYYGENGIDAWMTPYFGASVYDDPAVYAKSSPINFIKNVRTPTLELAGENDIECPWPQTQEFWHALDYLGIPTESVIYAGEGHGFRDPKHLEDYEQRVVGWFGRYLK